MSNLCGEAPPVLMCVPCKATKDSSFTRERQPDPDIWGVSKEWISTSLDAVNVARHGEENTSGATQMARRVSAFVVAPCVCGMDPIHCDSHHVPGQRLFYLRAREATREWCRQARRRTRALANEVLVRFDEMVQESLRVLCSLNSVCETRFEHPSGLHGTVQGYACVLTEICMRSRVDRRKRVLHRN